ncbi:MAG TPA: NADH-quinone oxidoreductase subunit NuoK [Cytophagaceae bacterium]|jgi:NADH:ubiquinone oxidoreductase subunit K|nr:NADH-quinone oxidoreductase subunit NuoK [Cytophagaceae bacterium]
MIGIENFMIVSAALFCIGMIIITTKKNAIVVLMGIELILNAANINLVAFSRYDDRLQGQMFALFVIVIAASEAAVALAIILNLYNYLKTPDPGKADQLKG